MQESFQTTTSDAITLRGIRLVSRSAGRPRLPIVMTHGWRESKECYLGLARQFASRGHDVLLFDLRGHGQSGGDTVTFGQRERHDVSRVLDHAQANGWIEDRVLTYGHSLGGSTMILHAALDDRVAGVISSCPFSDIRTAIASFHQAWAPWINLPWAMRGLEEAAEARGIDLSESSPRRAMRSVRAPVLLALAGEDGHLPIAEHGRVICDVPTESSVDVVLSATDTHLTMSRKMSPYIQRAIEDFTHKCEAA